MPHPVGEKHFRATAPDSEVEIARQLHDAGLGYRVIARKMERSPWTVRDWLEYRTR